MAAAQKSQPSRPRLSQLEYPFPDLLVLRELLDIVGANRIDNLRSDRILRFDLWMSGGAAAHGIDLLTFRGRRPAGKEPRGIRMRRILEDRNCDDTSESFRKRVTQRGPFLDPLRIMMRIAGEAGRRLARDQKLRELRVAFVELHIVGGNLGEDGAGFFYALVLVHQSYDQLGISRLRNQPVFPFGIRKVVKELGLFFVLYQILIPRADEEDHIISQPIGAL